MEPVSSAALAGFFGVLTGSILPLSIGTAARRAGELERQSWEDRRERTRIYAAFVAEASRPQQAADHPQRRPHAGRVGSLFARLALVATSQVLEAAWSVMNDIERRETRASWSAKGNAQPGGQERSLDGLIEACRTDLSAGGEQRGARYDRLLSEMEGNGTSGPRSLF